jgi:hypothetical protein
MSTALITISTQAFGADTDFKDTIDADVSNMLAGKAALWPINDADLQNVSNLCYL